MNSGPLDIQPIAKARQARKDDAHNQLQYHPDAMPVSANTVTHWAGDPGIAFSHVGRRAGMPTIWL